MRGSRIAEYEKWPMGGVRPSVRVLKILATIYETTWDRLVDIDDLEAMPALDRQELLGGQEAPAWIRVVDDAPRPPPELMDQKEADPTLPISIYLEDARESTIRDVQTALHTLAREIGFDIILESAPMYGSFWQKFRAKASDPNTQEEIYDRLIKLERSAEIRLLAVPESQANMQNAQGLAAIIEALKAESAAVVQLGPLVVVKTPTSDNRSAILCRTLTAKELRMLEARPDLLRNPCKLMAQLTVAEQDGPIEQIGDAGQI
jgi:transcriptional regulator with XRE-family HTH domain